MGRWVIEFVVIGIEKFKVELDEEIIENLRKMGDLVAFKILDGAKFESFILPI